MNPKANSGAKMNNVWNEVDNETLSFFVCPICLTFFDSKEEMVERYCQEYNCFTKGENRDYKLNPLHFSISLPPFPFVPKRNLAPYSLNKLVISCADIIGDYNLYNYLSMHGSTPPSPPQPPSPPPPSPEEPMLNMWNLIPSPSPPPSPEESMSNVYETRDLLSLMDRPLIPIVVHVAPHELARSGVTRHGMPPVQIQELEFGETSELEEQDELDLELKL